ncbi:MAG: hypothetical protein NC094_08525 [Bacteroidales bacterium]|nr:hypothetical protein [Lachnoclostridium sp.]MCM1384059.1 hypothetical protein [Lachnoclostridium sp.]MCM1465449.1 hypothetical protein [Bacteroidales bacterium]
MKLDKNRYISVIFTLMAVFCGIVWAFTNVGYDSEYQIAMAYRLIKGDKMILEMWEPHQTSALLPAVLMWLYLKLFHTTTGIVLYLQICGILIRGGLAFLLYRLLRDAAGKSAAYGMALFYFMVSPKDYALPEFSNLQLWFSTLLLCGLWSYLKRGKRYLLLLAAVWLCLEVLAYPSCAIVLISVIIILVLYAPYKWRDILSFSGVCAGLGLAVAGYFLVTIGPDTLKECIMGMLNLEPTHATSGILKIQSYLWEILEIGIILLAAGVMGWFVSIVLQAVFRRKGVGTSLWFLCCSVVLLVGFFLNILSVENRNAYGIIFLFLVGIGFYHRNILEEKEKKVYVCGSLIGGAGFLATLILTDMGFLNSVPYGILATMMALLPIKRWVDKMTSRHIRKGSYLCFWCLMALLAFRCFYIRIPLTGRGQIGTSFSDMSIVRSGPAFGIVSDEEGVCIQRDSYPEWKEWIRPGDKVWIVGGVVDTLGYLYEDVEVAGPSTMSTPSYSETVLEYWRLNPDKEPDVVVAEGYRGDLVYELLSNPWFLEWLEQEYRPEYVAEGEYWIYYFREAR